MSNDSDSDDTVEWDHVAIPRTELEDHDADEGQEQKPIHVVLKAPPSHKLPSAASEAAVSSYILRTERIAIHKAHVISLLASASVRNAMLNDELLHARLMSKTPLRIQNAFHAYSVRTHPNERDRSRLFDTALRDLCRWWFLSFEIDSLSGIRYYTWNDLQKEIQEYRGVHPYKSSSVSSEGYTSAKLGYHEHFVPSFRKGEPVRSVNSLMKRALLMTGSSDMSAQLFTALCRAIDVPARLVFSLQPISGRLSADKSSSSSTSPKKRATEYYEPPSPESGSVEIVTMNSTYISSNASSPSVIILEPSNQPSSKISAKSTKNQQAVPVKRGKPVKQKEPSPRISSSPDPEDQSEPPVFWTEVFCRTTKEWITVDPVRGIIRAQQLMQPSKTNKRNKMMYVIALEEDLYIRDVTARYAKQMGSETMKLRLTSRKSDDDFWEQALKSYKRPYKLDRDQREDAELLSAQYREPMPNSISGFKNHPMYVLERHLKREETLHPRKQIGMFRGEPVFPRSSLVLLKSAETWMREGRQIKSGEQAMKMVKQRAVTINKRRAQELASVGGHETQQGLYAHRQTELVVPLPVVDGKVPRNSYGNLDLFAPHMLPKGGAFLPYKGIAKIARKLGVDFADAVTGFEFKQRRAVPIISGIVVPRECKEVVLEAFMAWVQGEYEKEQAKKEERCLKKWGKLIRGLQIRQRLQNSYKMEGEEKDYIAASSSGRKSMTGKKRRRINEESSNGQSENVNNQLRNLEFDESESAHTYKERQEDFNHISRNVSKSNDGSDIPIMTAVSATVEDRRIPLLSEIWAKQNEDEVDERNVSNMEVGEARKKKTVDYTPISVADNQQQKPQQSKARTRSRKINKALTNATQNGQRRFLRSSTATSNKSYVEDSASN